MITDAPVATPGSLIVFEGPDGVGKSTIAREVAGKLGSSGSPPSLLSFPGRSPGTIGKLVYDVHHNPEGFGVSGMSATAKQALHIAAHLDAIERVIVPLLTSGSYVILDRFWWSTLVYGLVDGVPDDVLKALIEAERVAWGAWSPKVIFVIDRDEPIDRDEDLGRWKLLRRHYLELADLEGRESQVEVVRNVSSLESTVTAVLEKLRSLGPVV